MAAVVIHYIVPAIHVLACLFLIVVVLLQTGKGADMGAVFGGGSQTLFGSGGAGNFLTKLTTATAIAFMVTSLILTYGASRMPGSTLIDRLPTAESESAPPPAPDTQAEAPTPAPPAEGPAARVDVPIRVEPKKKDAAPEKAPAGQEAPAEEPAPTE